MLFNSKNNMHTAPVVPNCKHPHMAPGRDATPQSIPVCVGVVRACGIMEYLCRHQVQFHHRSMFPLMH